MLPIFLFWLERCKCLPALCMFWAFLRLQFSGHSLQSFLGIHSPHIQSRTLQRLSGTFTRIAGVLSLHSTFLSRTLSWPQPSWSIISASFNWEGHHNWPFPLLCITLQNKLVSFLQQLTVLHCLFFGICQHLVYISCCCSVAQSCLTLCDPMDCSTPGLPVLHCLPELAQTHVHRVSDVIQPSHPLSPPSPPAFNLSHHQRLFQWVSSWYQVATVLKLQHQSF